MCVCVCVCGCVFLSHRVFWCPLAESFPDSGSVGLFDSCNLSRPGHGEIRERNLIRNLRLSLRHGIDPPSTTGWQLLTPSHPEYHAFPLHPHEPETNAIPATCVCSSLLKANLILSGCAVWENFRAEDYTSHKILDWEYLALGWKCLRDTRQRRGWGCERGEQMTVPKAFRSSSRTVEVNLRTRQRVVTTANSKLYERTM